MPSQTPSPYAAIKSKFKQGRMCLVSGKTMLQILNAAEADRIITGDNIEEAPSQNGRTLSGTSAGYKIVVPFQVSSFRADSGSWYIRIATNGGTFSDVNGKPIEPLDIDENGNIDILFDAGDKEKFAVALLWSYQVTSDDIDLTVEVKKYVTEGDDLKEIITPISASESIGISRVVLAVGIGAGSGDDHTLKIEKQLVTTSLRAAWLPHYIVKGEDANGQETEELNAAQGIQPDVGRIV